MVAELAGFMAGFNIAPEGLESKLLGASCPLVRGYAGTGYREPGPCVACGHVRSRPFGLYTR